MGVQSLLRPNSVAIVGASDKIGPGFNAWKALRHVGYSGDVYLVNPNKAELFGRRAYPSLNDVPGRVDAAFVSVQAASVLEVAQQAIAKEAGGLAILSSGFGEAGEDGARAQRDLTALAEKHGVAVCGPNCLGLLNFSGSSALFGTSLPDQVERGSAAAIVQSGSIGIALLNAARGLGLSYLITSGNEAVTTAADYLEAILDEDEVATVILFAEQIKKPRRRDGAYRRRRRQRRGLRCGAAGGGRDTGDVARRADRDGDPGVQHEGSAAQARRRRAFALGRRDRACSRCRGAGRGGAAIREGRRGGAFEAAAQIRQYRQPARSDLGRAVQRRGCARLRARARIARGGRHARPPAGRAQRPWGPASGPLLQAAELGRGGRQGHRPAACGRVEPFRRHPPGARKRRRRGRRALSAWHAGRLLGDRALCAMGGGAAPSRKPVRARRGAGTVAHQARRTRGSRQANRAGGRGHPERLRS